MARQNRALRIAQDTAHQAMFDAEGRATPGLHRALLRAVEVQRPLVLANLRRMRRQRPHDTPAQLSARLERDYLAAVAGAGAAVGGSAAIPGVGTVASLGLSAVATVGFLEATAFYAASVAELHGVHLEDPDRARTTVMAIMLGEEGTALLSAFTGQALGRSNGAKGAWGAAVNRSLPASAVKALQGRLQKRFLAWLLRKQGTALLGRAVPFGIGAVVGGAGNLMMGRAVIRATSEAFGGAPDVLPGEFADDAGARPRGSAAPKAIPGAGTPGETPEQQVEREIEERRARLREQARSEQP
ncbi:hypothetical protein [Sinomonas mesophila]|uniref:hypothetical protein n=1 Tax=Sinomonas mesophila TaxID=1531955 RepID=UPI001FE98389|nr:hypothetical protein [Sinomonas mesophila]